MADDTKKPFWRRIAQTLLVIVCILFAWLVFDYFMALGGVDIWPSGKEVNSLTGNAQGHAISAAVGWIAGSVGLVTFFLNRSQKDQHHVQQLKQAREFENEKERRERELAELSRLETLFAELAEDFSSASTLERINAAIGLAELAQTPDPRRMGPDGEPPEAPYGDHKSAKCKDNYPYFLRAANRLAAALHQWEEQSALDEVRKALRQMATFANDEGTLEPLLHHLANTLADANRTALRVFVSVLAEGLAFSNPLLLRKLSAFCAFLPTTTGNARCLNQLRKTMQAKQAFGHLLAARQALKLPGQNQVDTRYLNRFASAAKLLCEARDALAECLQLLSEPPYLRSLAVRDHPVDTSTRHRMIEIQHDRRGLYLEETFLAGAVLTEANLQSSILSGADLQEAELSLANLQAAWLRDTNLNQAQLTGASMQDSAMSGARLCGATLSWSSLQGAELTRSQLQGTNLHGAQCGQTAGDPRASFDPGGWQLADFSDPYGGDSTSSEDITLRKWLKKNFPPRQQS
ncbi:MAG: pentapeptide repeat-containing protein [Chthonomonas sp.]|nr:pentapeptide repeat-containing protein [Chthonomonas sp.]